MRVAIYGGGNLGHALAGRLAARPDLDVRVLVYRPDRVAAWHDGGRPNEIVVRGPDGTVAGRPRLVTADVAAAVGDAEAVLIALPSFLHRPALERLRPHVGPGVFVGALPATGGFDWQAAAVFPDPATRPTLFGVNAIPWMCKATAYGREATVLGHKQFNLQSTLDPAMAPQVSALLTDLTAMPVLENPSFLNITLAPGNPIIHTAIVEDIMRGWDGRPFAEPPLIYEDLSPAAAERLEALSDDVQTLCAAIEAQIPDCALIACLPIHESTLLAYGAAIADPSTLRSTFRTNAAYRGVRFPMKPVPGGFVPDLDSRFFHEDVPFGLVVLQGLAEIAGVRLPAVEDVLGWAQGVMGREYLVGGRLAGRDVATSGAPQRHGIATLAEAAATRAADPVACLRRLGGLVLSSGIPLPPALRDRLLARYPALRSLADS